MYVLGADSDDLTVSPSYPLSPCPSASFPLRLFRLLPSVEFPRVTQDVSDPRIEGIHLRFLRRFMVHSVHQLWSIRLRRPIRYSPRSRYQCFLHPPCKWRWDVSARYDFCHQKCVGKRIGMGDGYRSEFPGRGKDDNNGSS